MKELKDMTAAELMTERKQIEKKWGIVPDVRRIEIGSEPLQPQYDAIAAEFDARCENAEISIINRAGMNQFKYGAYIDGTNGVWLGIPAVEQHALEGYLLSKEVKP